MGAHEEAGVGLRRTVEIISVFSICSHVGGMNEKRSEKNPSNVASFKAAARRDLYIARHFCLRKIDALIDAHETAS
jgi:hypothetical protein